MGSSPQPLFASLGLAVLLLCLPVRPVFGDPITVAGNTTGSFSYGFTDLGSETGGLSFSGRKLWPTTSTSLELGYFHLLTLLADFDLFEFHLFVDFSEPADASAAMFVAALSGLVTSSDDGPVTMVFGAPAHITYPSGSFDLTIQNVTLYNHAIAPLLGTISNVVTSPVPAPVPEPTALVLMLVGAAGPAGRVLRRASSSVGVASPGVPSRSRSAEA